MKNTKIKNTIITAMLLAVGYLLPLLTGQVKGIGKMLLPMHIPVILCGFICGPWYGIVLGILLPLTRSLLFGMPQLFPSAVAMMPELAAYGFVTGFIYDKSKNKNTVFVYAAMIPAQIIGRIVWGIARMLLSGVAGNFSLALFMAGAFTEAIPGIILQLILIPIIMGIYNIFYKSV